VYVWKFPAKHNAMMKNNAIIILPIPMAEVSLKYGHLKR